MAKRKPRHYILEAFYIGESVDLREAQKGLRHYTFLNRDHPLIVEYLPGSAKYIGLTKFGVVCFWNVDEAERKRFLAELAPYLKAQREQYPYSDSLEVNIQNAHERITSRGLNVTDLDMPHLKIISYAVSQSVALERYEDEVEKILLAMEGVISNLKAMGKARLRERELLKQVGSALAVRQTAISHLSLFDAPEETWELPELDKLYSLLKAEFDLQDRFAVLDHKISFLSDSSQLLMEVIAEKRASLLEIIIIILISIELIPLVLEISKVIR